MPTGRRLRTALTSAFTGFAVIASLLVAGGTAQAAGPVLDGTTAALAAPSCWSIKQDVPASADGIYWLQTAKLESAQQFYCDMTTDGGGWVLIGRGRDGWNWSPDGQGSASTLRTTITGTAAFSPAALPTATVNGLLGGADATTLTDGIRLRRATNDAGSSWQDVRLYLSDTKGWNWTIGAGLHLANVRVDGQLYSGGNSQSWAANTTNAALSTGPTSRHNYRMGFGLGSGVRSTNTTTNYLWSYTTEQNALAFTQVWIRPKLTDGGFTAIPDAGLPASTVRPLMKSTTEPMPWGVTGVVGGYKNELTLPVEAFAYIGNTTYVGGMFTTVQKGATPGVGESIAQPYLAAFNTTTGEWISTFRPVLDGVVWDLEASPDGKLLVGGDFTNVNSATGTTGLAKLDPVTGAVDATWRANVQWVTSGTPAPAEVKAMDIQGSYLYIGGRFNRVQGSTSPVITLGRAARIRLTDGMPDGTWKPNFDGTIIELDASAQGDRVWFSGYFNSVNGIASPRVAGVYTANQNLITGLGPFVPSTGSATTAQYQQTVKEYGDQVWLGGSQHILTQYDRTTFARLRSNIMKSGGDLQSMTFKDGVVYASCHCGHFQYSDTFNFSDPISGASRANRINYIGAWDAVTGDFLQDFYIGALDAQWGNGVWAMEIDPQGCMWFGGDISKGSGSSWLGGFGKVCPRDTTAPTTPTNLAATRSAGNVRLTWTPSTDASSFTQQVFRDDRVIAVVSPTTAVFNTPDIGNAKYFVRAVDSAGNYSASTPALTLGAGDTTAPTAPGTPTLTSATATSITLSWAASTDNTGVAGYRVFRNGTQVGGNITSGTSFTDTGLSPTTAYSYTVVAYDAAGNTSTASGAASLSTTTDTTAPTAPTGLAVSSVTQTSLHLAWNASTDNIGVTSYRVKRNGTDVSGPLTALAFDDSGLTANTSYSYTVTAYDAAGNSTTSSPLSVTTAGAGGITPYFTDSFTGTSGPWGTGWTTNAVSGSATLSSNMGSLAYTDVAGAYSRALLTAAGTTVTDADVTFTYAWSTNAAKSYVDIGLRGSGGWQNSYRTRNGYYVEISSNSGTVVIGKTLNGVATTITTVSGVNALTTGQQKIRLQAIGSTFRFRIWPAANAEPASWNWSGTDTDVSTAGQFFISEVRASTNVGDKAILLDDFSISPTA